MVSGSVKVRIEIGDKIVTFEGPQDFVDRQVAKYISLGASSHSTTNTLDGSPAADSAATSTLSERELVSAKNPKGHSETVAVLAFGLSEAGVKEFTEEDMRKAYIRAGVRPPKVVAQAIRDAKNSFDYVEKGSKSGTYRLSNHGDRTVRFDLPRKAVGKG